MVNDSTGMPERSYGCTFGCGNPYDFVVVTVSDGTTEFLCLPCFIRLASDMLAAVNEPDNENVKAAMEWAASNPTEAAPGPKGRGSRKNAPATNSDPDIFSAYDGVITVDELPEEFR